MADLASGNFRLRYNNSQVEFTADGVTWQKLGPYPLALPAGVSTIMCLGDSQVQGTGGGTTGSAAPVGAMMGIGGDTTGGFREPLWRLLAEAGLIPNGNAQTFVGGVATTSANFPLDLTHAHEGHPGFTTADINANIAAYVAANPATMFIYKIGANNMGSAGLNQSAAVAAAAVQASIAVVAAAAPGIPILYATPYFGSDISAKRAAFIALIPGIIATLRNQSIRVNWVDVSQCGPAADTLHQNFFGYRAEAGLIFKALTTLVF